MSRSLGVNRSSGPSCWGTKGEKWSFIAVKAGNFSKLQRQETQARLEHELVVLSREISCRTWGENRQTEIWHEANLASIVKLCSLSIALLWTGYTQLRDYEVRLKKNCSPRPVGRKSNLRNSFHLTHMNIPLKIDCPRLGRTVVCISRKCLNPTMVNYRKPTPICCLNSFGFPCVPS